MRIPALLFVPVVFLCLACNSGDTAEHAETTTDPMASLSGEQLAGMFCVSCHLYPEPALLDKTSWRESILPRMGEFMGIYATDSTRAGLIEDGPGGAEVEAANVYPTTPMLSAAAFGKIKDFYLQNAPDTPLPPPSREIATGLKQFKVETSPMRLSPPSTTMIKVTDEGDIYIGDAHTQTLYEFNNKLELQRAAKVRESAVSLRRTDEALLVTVMGSFSPTDAPSGMLLALPRTAAEQPRIVLKGLKRPVHSSFADFNGDGSEEIVTSEFGKWTGGLSVWRQEEGAWKSKKLRNRPGAIRAYTPDLNNDGLQDIIALFGQGDEGIWIYLNKGNGRFSEKAALRFPPSYGSSYFNLHDLDNDGDLDIVYTAGDNADFKPITKHYHGIRIFLNDGELNFTEQLYYQLNGAYNAIPYDFDGDGDTDIAAISFFPDWDHTPEEGFVYLENQGDFNFSASTFEGVAELGRWIVMDKGDIDNDGDMDLVLGSLAFEVVAEGNWVQNWVEGGVPFVVLRNTRN